MKAITTRYKGHRFRSRTEARWAVFFQTLDVRWYYEEQGYVLRKNGCYLPDFKLILPSEEVVYCEVNGSEADEHEPSEESKLREFAKESGCRVLLLTGVPDYRAYNQFTPTLDANSYNAAFFRDYSPWIETADAYWFSLITLDHQTGRLHFDFDDRRAKNAFGRGLVAAVLAARGARFEHGETPQ